MSRKPDPRPQRTRQLLSQAIFELIQEKRWDRIRVQDILDRTGVGRSTFYAHFDNKLDLVTSGIPSTTLPISIAEGEPDLLPLFEHVAEMRPILLPLMSQPMLAEIMEAFEQGLADAWTEHLTTVGVDPSRRGTAAALLAGGFMAVVRRWIANGCDPSPAVLCAEFTEYSSLILATSRSSGPAA